MENTKLNLSGGGLTGKSLFEQIISLENLFSAWKEFRKGKRKKFDVQQFEKNLKENIFKLHKELSAKTYQHSEYVSFYISDPKLRKIHKATVRDRVLHHAVFRILYPIFDKSFIFDSYSCRLNKGTHRAVNRLDEFARRVSRNNTRNCFILKMDVKKFFDSVSQEILTRLLEKKIQDESAIWLIKKVIKSFPKGLPLGNITSQLFANVYLNELDRFAKHDLKIKHYIRYCDDFVILTPNREYLIRLIARISEFLKKLKLSLHSDKISIIKYHLGVDFLGYVSFSYYRVLRPKTKRRMLNKLEKKMAGKDFSKTLQSYFGVLSHCNSHKLRRKIISEYGV